MRIPDSLCLPGYAMSGGVCQKCESDVDMDQLRMIVLVVVCFGMLLGWVVLCCKSLLPMVQGLIAKIVGLFAAKAGGAMESNDAATGAVDDAMGTLETITDCLATGKETIEDCLPAELFEGDGATAMLKVVMSFYQVVSGFLSFNVKWPQFIIDLMLISENVNFSIMTLPGLSCILMGTSYKMKLLSYTIGPLFLYLLIVLPCILAKIFLGRKRLREGPWKLRYEAARRTMMNNICFFSFLIYPTVSMTVLKGLQCRDFGPPIGALIVTDVNIVCPYGREDGDSFLYYYTLSFVFVYPLGIPLLLWLILKAYQIPQMATRKTIQSGLSVMIQMYMGETCEVCLKNLAAILWSDEKVQSYFRLVSSGKRIVLKDLNTVHSKDSNRKFKELLLAVVKHMEVTEDLDLVNFRKLVADVVEKVGQSTKEFKGPDTKMDMLTSAQMKLLIRHEFKCDRGELEAPEFSLMDSLQEEAPEVSTKKTSDDIFADLEAGEEHEPDQPPLIESGCKWENAGAIKPIRGRELTHHELKNTLQSQTQFTQEKMEVFGISRLRMGDFIKSGDSYFIAVEATLQLDAEAQTLHPHENAAEAQTVHPQQHAFGRKKKKRPSKKERMKMGTEERVEHLDKPGLKEELSQRILALVKSGVLALPPMAWDGEEEDEKLAVREVGSLFCAYRPNAWKFELFETFRKLLMVAMLLFVYEGKPLQVASAFIVTFLVTMYVQKTQPYTTVQLNNMAVFSFIGTLATLFYGLLAMANDGDPDIDPDGIDQVLMRYLVMFINIFVVMLPFADMEGLSKLPFSIIACVVCCIGPICVMLGLKKKEEGTEEEQDDPYNSDDELDGLHGNDPYHAAYSAMRRKEVNSLFDKIDKDQSGKVLRDELFAGLKKSGYTQDRCSEIFQTIDADGSQEISREEFARYFLKESTTETSAPDASDCQVDAHLDAPASNRQVDAHLAARCRSLTPGASGAILSSTPVGGFSAACAPGTGAGFSSSSTLIIGTATATDLVFSNDAPPFAEERIEKEMLIKVGQVHSKKPIQTNTQEQEKKVPLASAEPFSWLFPLWSRQIPKPDVTQSSEVLVSGFVFEGAAAVREPGIPVMGSAQDEGSHAVSDLWSSFFSGRNSETEYLVGRRTNT